MALTTPIESLDDRPSCCEYATGRVFYGFRNNIYYSQVMEAESIDKLSKCYQANDPTAEQLSDVLATDGGTIQVNDANSIVQIKNFKNGVLIYALNGVWYLSGPDTGFTATNFSLTQVNSSGCISPQSVVVVEDAHYYWSNEGLFSVGVNKFGSAESINIIEGTTQSFYSAIPMTSKKRSYGVYNRIRKQVEWHYSSTDQTGATDYREAKDLSLILDLRTGGVWPQSYNRTKQEAAGQFIACPVNTTQATESQDSVVVVIDAGTVTTTQDYSIDFGLKTDTSFQDFSTNYTTAYIETGYETLDKPSNKKVAPYITTHFSQTEQNWINDGSGGLTLDFKSGCQMRAKWDWNDSSTNGRWSPAQQAYKFRRVNVPAAAGAFDSGETVITTKSKMLGRGNALSIRFEQEANKDMKLLGYTVQYNVKGRM